MKLVYLSDYPHKNSIYKLESLRISCVSGIDMSKCMRKVQSICYKGAMRNNNSAVVWESGHHEILLWFEDEKYRTYFSLKMDGVGAQ